MPDKITVSQFDEIIDVEDIAEDFVERLEEYTGIVAEPYTAYVYFDSCGDYIGCSEEQTMHEILREAGIEVVPDD